MQGAKSDPEATKMSSSLPLILKLLTEVELFDCFLVTRFELLASSQRMTRVNLEGLLNQS